MALNVRQQKFVDAYARLGNATQAAKDAGYSEHTAHVQGHDLLKNPKIRAALEQALKDTAPTLTREIIQRELWKNHLACQPQLLEVPVIVKGKVAAMRMAIVGDTAASNRALELLARMGGMMVERAKVEVVMTHDLVEQSIADLEAQLAANDPEMANDAQ